jgi:hypothetical protein
MTPLDKLGLTALLLASAILISLPGWAERAGAVLKQAIKRRRTRLLRRRFRRLYERLEMRTFR